MEENYQLTFNVLTFTHPQPAYTFHFSNMEQAGLHRVHKYLVPDEVVILDIPSFEVQQAVIKLKNLHEQDIHISQQLIKEKQKLFQEITHKLIHQDEA